ncbi:MAG TPA: hypothetical protein VJ728_04550 [Candidatus Binataceae bacterium]|nr:hypothetical protein [Candidatus Binataceae bacterium]
MEYQLEIYRPGSIDSGGIIRMFSASAPFMPIRVGDLLNTTTWGKNLEWQLLRVVGVEHLISDSTSAGIDPAGAITHRVLLFTESVPNTTEARRKSPGSV